MMKYLWILIVCGTVWGQELPPLDPQESVLEVEAEPLLAVAETELPPLDPQESILEVEAEPLVAVAETKLSPIDPQESVLEAKPLVSMGSVESLTCAANGQLTEEPSQATRSLALPPQDPLRQVTGFQGCAVQRGLVISPFVAAHVGKGVGYERYYNTVGAYLFPAGGNRLHPFFDAKVHSFSDRRTACNIGIGARYATCGQYAAGINLYYDFRQGCWGDFHQMGLGAELFTRCFDFRLNTYFPITKSGCRKKCVFDQYEEGYVITCQKCQLSMAVADAEIARCLYQRCHFSIQGAIGPYFLGNSCRSDVVGGKIRLTARYKSLLFLDLFGTYDDLFGKKLCGRITLSIPMDYFCGCLTAPKQECCIPLSPLCCPVYRSEIIPLRTRCLWDWNYNDDCQ